MSSGIPDLRDCRYTTLLKHVRMDVVQWIRDGLDKPGKQKQGLAAALGISRSAVTELLAGRRNLLASEIAPAAAYLEVEPPPFHRSRFVPVMGQGAADATSLDLRSSADEPLDWVSVPQGDDDSKFALEVVGNSMRGIASEGWLVFFDEPHTPPTPDQYDQLCVVRLKSGQTLIKFLRESRYPDRYDLESATEPMLIAQEVEWAAVIETIATAKQASKLLRISETAQNPNFLKIENPG